MLHASGAPEYAPLLQKLRELIPPERILLQAPMALYTTLKVGGPADILVKVKNAGEIVSLKSLAQTYSVPVMIIGNGSNLLVRDGGIRGLVLRLGEEMSDVAVTGNTIRAQAGAPLPAVSRVAARHGLTGLEYACGIPGTVGGGIYMNAGAYGGELSQVIREVEAVTPEGEVHTYPKEEMRFSYRHSRIQDEGLCVTSAVFALSPGNKEEIWALMKDYARRRSEKQPLECPSCGSTFKRPEGYYAGQLIDEAGLRGVSVGGAQVSHKHAGFLINTGDATASDFLSLIAHVQQTVLFKQGVQLMPEVRIVGEDSLLKMV